MLEGVGHRVHVLSALSHAEARCADLVGDFVRLGLDLVDELGDLLGALPGALGELADLVGNHREPATGLAGAGRLDRGIEREQVRAARHAGDHLGELTHVACLLLEFEDPCLRFFHPLEDRPHLLDRQTGEVHPRVGLLIGLG